MSNRIKVKPNAQRLPNKSKRGKMPDDPNLRLICEVVDGLDISDIIEQCGAPAYQQRSLLEAIMLAYLGNYYTCDKIVDQIKWDRRCIWLCGGGMPSCRALSAFRSIPGVNEVFARVLLPLLEAGEVNIATVYNVSIPGMGVLGV